MRRRWKVALAAVPVLLVAAFVLHCTGPRVAPPVGARETPLEFSAEQRQPGFTPGESAKYNVRLYDVLLARCRLGVQEVEHEGKACLKPYYRVKSASIVNVFKTVAATGETLVDRETMLPIRHDHRAVESDRRKHTVIEYDHANKVAHYSRTRTGEPVKNRQFPIDSQPDALCALVQLRTARPELKEPMRMKIWDGRRLYEVCIERTGEQKLATPVGVFEAIELRLTTRKLPRRAGEKPGEWTAGRVWLARDTWLLLKFDATMLVGSGTAELVELDRSNYQGQILPLPEDYGRDDRQD